MPKSYFTENLKNIRKYHKITLEELSEATKVSKSTISDYENDKFSPTIIIARKFSDYFNLSLDQMEYSELLEKTDNGSLKIKENDQSHKQLNELKEYNEVIGKQKDELMLELRLQKQKVDSMHIQLKLQEQLQQSKLAEIILLRTQISLLEEKINLNK